MVLNHNAKHRGNFLSMCSQYHSLFFVRGGGRRFTPSVGLATAKGHKNILHWNEYRKNHNQGYQIYVFKSSAWLMDASLKDILSLSSQLRQEAQCARSPLQTVLCKFKQKSSTATYFCHLQVQTEGQSNRYTASSDHLWCQQYDASSGWPKFKSTLWCKCSKPAPKSDLC